MGAGNETTEAALKDPEVPLQPLTTNILAPVEGLTSKVSLHYYRNNLNKNVLSIQQSLFLALLLEFNKHTLPKQRN